MLNTMGVVSQEGDVCCSMGVRVDCFAIDGLKIIVLLYDYSVNGLWFAGSGFCLVPF